MMVSPPRPELARVQSRLLPQIRTPGSGAERILVRDHLAIGLVVETPEGYFPVRDADLASWSADIDLLLNIAIENLHIRSSSDAWVPVETVPGILVYFGGDGQAAARILLLEELLESCPIEGALVMVPAPDQLLCVPLEGPDALEALKVLLAAGQLAHQVSEEPLSNQAFWYDGSEFHLVPLFSDDENVEALPPPGLLEAFERMTVLAYAMAAEA